MSIADFVIWNSLLNNSSTDLDLSKDWSFLDLVLAVGTIAIAGIALIALGVGISFLVMTIIDWCSDTYRKHKVNKRKKIRKQP